MFNLGEYYVGDLCYVLSAEEWAEVCDLLDVRGDGKHVLTSGKQIGILYTAHGDGEYQDQFDNDYGVDSGTIGCVLASDIDVPIDDTMVLIDFQYDFDIGEADGVLSFGHINIETSSSKVWDEIAFTDDAEYDWDNDSTYENTKNLLDEVESFIDDYDSGYNDKDYD